MRTFPPGKKSSQNEEMLQLKRELRLPPENTELLLSLPRTFSRQSARFELPLDKRVLNSKLYFLYTLFYYYYFKRTFLSIPIMVLCNLQ